MVKAIQERNLLDTLDVKITNRENRFSIGNYEWRNCKFCGDEPKKREAIEENF